jgi:hypothetical protein
MPMRSAEQFALKGPHRVDRLLFGRLAYTFFALRQLVDDRPRGAPRGPAREQRRDPPVRDPALRISGLRPARFANEGGLPIATADFANLEDTPVPSPSAVISSRR